SGATTTGHRPGLIPGPPAYISPEQHEGDSSKVGPASDIYSLGVILYQLATGRPPYSGDPFTIYGRILRAPPPAPSRLRSELDETFDALCLMAMARRPEDRFPSMPAFATALEHYAPDKPKNLSQPIEPRAVFEQPPTTPTRTRALRHRPRRLGTWVALLAALLLTGAVVGVGFWLNREKSDESDGDGGRSVKKDVSPKAELALR